jgi:fumarate reductase subunit D
MNCKNCQQSLDEGAAFCGNCGQPVHYTGKNHGLSAPIAHAGATAVAAQFPRYALATPSFHSGEIKAVLSLLFGVIGIIGALLTVIVGLIFGIIGLVLGTMAHRTIRHRLSLIGSILSILAILINLGVWAYLIQHAQHVKHANLAAQAQTVASATLNTPCYSTGFIDQLNVSNTPDSCDMNAFNGPTAAESNNAYKVLADKVAVVNANNFETFAKRALEKDVQMSLPSFAIDSERYTAFAGSPAYIVTTHDTTRNVALVEAVVFHEASNGSNVFVLVHAAGGLPADLSTIERQWQWK